MLATNRDSLRRCSRRRLLQELRQLQLRNIRGRIAREAARARWRRDAPEREGARLIANGTDEGSPRQRPGLQSPALTFVMKLSVASGDLTDRASAPVSGNGVTSTFRRIGGRNRQHNAELIFRVPDQGIRKPHAFRRHGMRHGVAVLVLLPFSGTLGVAGRAASLSTRSSNGSVVIAVWSR